MAYIRKTIDVYTIQGLYYGTWEDETTETNRRGRGLIMSEEIYLMWENLK